MSGSNVVGIVTSDKAPSLNRVSEDVARVIKESTGYLVRIYRGYRLEILRELEDSNAIIVMPFDPAPAITYFYLAWELKKRARSLVFYTTIEGRVYRPSVPNWILRDLEFVANSRYTMERVSEVGARVVDLIYHGVDVELFQSTKQLRELGRKRLEVSAEDFLIGYLAGCYMRKGHQLFAEVLKILAEKDSSIKAVILTDRKCAEYYKSLPNAIPLIDFGRLINREICMFYHSLDLYVQASLSEGFGLPVLEALAAGKLVVHSDYDPLSEITTPDTSVRVPVTHVEFRKEVSSIEYELHFYDPKDMADAILYAKDLVLKAKDDIETKAVERAKEFDFRKTYKRFLDYLR